ncbi:MAG: trypsin-like peptidase domain-containing protein [Candidatus Falkowbacteria bacterium]
MKLKNELFFLLLALCFGAGIFGAYLFYAKGQPATARDYVLDEEAASIMAIKKVIPAVVSIIVYDWDDFVTLDSPTGKPEVVRKRQAKLKGTGFLISSDGFIVTNKHVVDAADRKTGEYRVILNSGKEYYAQYIDKDPMNDLAVLKIFDKDLPVAEMGNSDNLELGSSVIAIGNALGRYENSATNGIVSGLGRSLFASDINGNTEALDNVIQTDAKINVGNSGGPLIDLAGRVVGINVAIDQAGSAIGFAIPVNDARPVVTSIRERGRIVRPALGVRYIMLTPEMALDNELPRSTGAWIKSGDSEVPAILPDSAAAKGGLKSGDIIFEINAIKLEGKNTLLSVVQKYKPGDKIGLKIQRGDKILILTVVLGEFK